MSNRIEQMIANRWEEDIQVSSHLNRNDHKYLYELLQRRGIEVLGETWRPNLVSPETFNDKINWCKLFDQQKDQVDVVDKVKAFQYLLDRGLGRYNRVLLASADSVAELNKGGVTGKCVFKCNHDSGSYRFFDMDQLTSEDTFWKDINTQYAPLLAREYGLRNAEWQYAMVNPRQILVERDLADGNGMPPDYKFHCTNGVVRWCKYIYDRKHGTKEINVLPDGTDTGVLFDTQFALGSDFTIPEDTWEEMLKLASQLSKPYKYVRVDLYSVKGRIYFGELTFFPRGGYYPGVGQKTLGKLLEFDTSTVTKPVLF